MDKENVVPRSRRPLLKPAVPKLSATSKAQNGRQPTGLSVAGGSVGHSMVRFGPPPKVTRPGEKRLSSVPANAPAARPKAPPKANPPANARSGPLRCPTCSTVRVQKVDASTNTERCNYNINSNLSCNVATQTNDATPPSTPCKSDEQELGAGVLKLLRSKTVTLSNGVRTYTIASLPEEVLSTVFQFLDLREMVRMARRVCRAWRARVMRPESWHTLWFHSRWKEQLILKACKVFSPHGKPEAWRSVVKIDLADRQGTNDMLVIRLIEGCPKLRLLWVPTYHTTDQTLQFIADKCPDLRMINLEKSKDITDTGVELLARGCKQLRFVYFNLNDRITDVSMRALANPGRGSLASLDSASSSSSSSSSYAPPLSRYLTPPPSHILEVALGTTHITDDGVEVIARASPNLRGVTFGSPRLTDRSLACLAQCCPRISEVHFHLCDGITDRGLELIGALKGLQSVHFKACKNITDAGIRALCEQCPVILDLVLSEDTRLTNLSLHYISTYLHLRRLSVSYCPLLTDDGLIQLSILPHLACLVLSGNRAITDQSVLPLQVALPTLKFLFVEDTGAVQAYRQTQEENKTNYCAYLELLLSVYLKPDYQEIFGP